MPVATMHTIVVCLPRPAAAYRLAILAQLFLRLFRVSGGVSVSCSPALSRFAIGQTA